MTGDLETVGSFQFLPEAEAARAHLEEHGITAFVMDGEMVNTDWFLGNALGYIKLRVPVEQAEAARELLEESQRRRRRRDEDESEGPEEPTCLSCGEIMPHAESKCAACGWSYADGVADDEVESEAADADEGELDTDDELDDSGETSSAMDDLRALKRPLFFLYLLPVLLGVGIGVLLLLEWIVGAIRR